MYIFGKVTIHLCFLRKVTYQIEQKGTFHRKNLSAIDYKLSKVMHHCYNECVLTLLSSSPLRVRYTLNVIVIHGRNVLK